MLIEDLMELGLTKYEASTFIALVSRGNNEARTISEISHVPFGRIYDVLNNLESKGLVEKKATRPQQFQAVKPQLAISRLMHFKESELQRLQDKSNSVGQKLLKLHKDLPQDSDFWNVSIGKSALSYFNDKILDATHSIRIYAEFFSTNPLDFLDHIKQLVERLRILRNQSVKIYLLIGIPPETNISEMFHVFYPIIGKDALHDIRLTHVLTTSFVVIDEEKTLLKIHNPANLQEYLATIFLWQTKLGRNLVQTFESLWEDGLKINPETMI